MVKNRCLCAIWLLLQSDSKVCRPSGDTLHIVARDFSLRKRKIEVFSANHLLG